MNFLLIAFLSGFYFFSLNLNADTKVDLDQLLKYSDSDHLQNIQYQTNRDSLLGQIQSEAYLPNAFISYEEMRGPSMGGQKQPQWKFQQKIPFPFKIFLRRDSYVKEIEGNQSLLNDSRRQRRSRITINYYKWLALIQKKNLLKEQDLLLSQLIAVQKTRYISQKASQVDLVALQIEKGYLMNSLSEIETELTFIRNDLNNLSGMKVGEENFLTEDCVPTARPLNLLPLLNLKQPDLGQKLRAQNFELQALLKSGESKISNLSAVNWEWFPDLEFMYTRGKDFRGMDFTGLQFGVEIPIWFGMSQTGRTNQARASAKIANLVFSEELRKKTIETESRLVEQRELRKQLDVMENGLIQLSSQNVKAARAQYQTGGMTYSNFLALIQSSYKTMIGYEDLKIKVIENQENLKILMGEI